MVANLSVFDDKVDFAEGLPQFFLCSKKPSTTLRIDVVASHVYFFSVSLLSEHEKTFQDSSSARLKPSSVQYCLGTWERLE
jgi:hypothetical protein